MVLSYFNIVTILLEVESSSFKGSLVLGNESIFVFASRLFRIELSHSFLFFSPEYGKSLGNRELYDMNHGTQAYNLY
ncbi:hypothetical protein DNHGIG_35000 [Collibacillus ludicampi]|uniref:Uncharacterized protein n=1 Tax=Collibacillus ludicampi TaxID=2771369 RepID=A0AAV4LJA0_9BACL|nr:hypothetical protein DNHGIG_35000 [Collibacillus ludicampi]